MMGEEAHSEAAAERKPIEPDVAGHLADPSRDEGAKAHDKTDATSLDRVAALMGALD